MKAAMSIKNVISIRLWKKRQAGFIIKPIMLNRQSAMRMLKENILPFWQNMADEENGGFFGEADFSGKINRTADKGGILNSRILWTFSAAYRLLGDEAYGKCAARAREFLSAAFLDREYGGLYWLVDCEGRPLNTRKQFYNMAFGIYALGEHYLAAGDISSLELALSLFDALEKYGLDSRQDSNGGGYIEARSRDWLSIDDFRLSGKDLNSPKSMNTNLHVLEAYTTLARAAISAERKMSAENGEGGQAGTSHICGPNTCAAHVRAALENILRVTLEKIVNDDFHFNLFFDMDWRSLVNEVSWGHDIEGSWLMYEAALVTGNESLISAAKNTAIAIAGAVHSAAIDHNNGGFLSGLGADGKIHDKKEWWPQAEAVVGFYNAYELSGERKFLEAADNIWTYTEKYFMDGICGEWHNELFQDNTPDKTMLKAGFWKCPYHNSRACLEIISRENGK